MLVKPDLHSLNCMVFWQFIVSPIVASNAVCYLLYSCQRVTMCRYVSCKVQISDPLLAPFDSQSGIARRFSHDKLEYDEKEKLGEIATLPQACVIVEHLGITNACLHTAA